jgi:predicted thioesterase
MNTNEALQIGVSRRQSFPVHEAITVGAHGTVPLPVLATPHLIFMLEDTCAMAVKDLLLPGEVTVGTGVFIDHLAAAYTGDQIDVVAELVSIRGRRLVFRVEGRSGKTVVSRGLHERATVTADVMAAGR